MTDINKAISQLETGDQKMRDLTIEKERVDNTLDLITALIARCINKARKRCCEACIKCVPNQDQHLCASQTYYDAVHMYFDDAYNATGINLINAMFIMDGQQIPPINIQAIKEHHREDIKQKLCFNLDSMTAGDLQVSRCALYMQPLFQFAS